MSLTIFRHFSEYMFYALRNDSVSGRLHLKNITFDKLKYLLSNSCKQVI